MTNLSICAVLQDESDESEADAGAADSSEDEEYVPSRNRRR